MEDAVQTRFSLKPVVAAISVVLGSTAFAAPTPNQMPGAGIVVAVSPGATTSYGGVGSPITGLVSVGAIGIGIGVNPRVVIQWGGAGAPVDPTNPAGFNLGANARLIFTSAMPGGAVLNIDASGSASQIFGKLESNTAIGFAPALYVANGNGIVVGAGGQIAAPSGIGLIGADLNNATAKYDFVGNNSSGKSYIDVTGGQSTVTVNGAINGSLTANLPATYILLAGGDIVNSDSGNQFAGTAIAIAGLRATNATDTVNGVAGTTVNRLVEVSGTTLGGLGSFNIGTLPGNWEIASAGSTVVNTGSISAPGAIALFAANGIRSGTAGDSNVLVGLFADAGIVTATYTSGAKTELYNVISGYTTNKALGLLYVNAPYATATGDVLINALTPGSQPSSISTTTFAIINGENVTINSTINHATNPTESVLQVTSTKSLTITAAVGGGGFVALSNSGAGGMSIGGNVVADTNKNSSGGIVISNSGKNAPTTISGNLTSYGDDI
ncbi:MAG: hypothetical protein ABI777_12930, partial [Betaproteobacteria bacterium]